MPIQCAVVRWQLPLVWLIGSAVTGTIAVLFTHDRGTLPVKPLLLFGTQEKLTLTVLVGAFVLAVFALGWRTIDATWLRPGDLRSPILWTAAVCAVGGVGWGFAGVATFALDFSLTTQLVLAYTCGGLPFALVAGMLLRPVAVNAAATLVTGIALLVGALLVDAPVQTGLLYLQLLVGGPFTGS